MSVNSENHVLGLWIGGGVTPGALKAIAEVLDEAVAEPRFSVRVRSELTDMANACHAQLSKLREIPKPDPTRYL